MRKQVTSQAKRALHLLYKRIDNLHLPFDLSLIFLTIPYFNLRL